MSYAWKYLQGVDVSCGRGIGVAGRGPGAEPYRRDHRKSCVREKDTLHCPLHDHHRENAGQRKYADSRETEVQALDSQGRRMFAKAVTSEDRPTTYVVHDPVARTETTWKVPGKRATVFASAAPGAARGCSPATDADPDSIPVTSGPHGNVTTENLGTASIQGVEARGTRRTRTIPAGAMGNEAPLVSTVERWTALTVGLNGLLVREIRDDPRSDKKTTELTDLEQSEPDVSVFQPPSGYEIVTKDASGCPTGASRTEGATRRRRQRNEGRHIRLA